MVSAAMLPAETYLSFTLTDGYNPLGTPIQTGDGALFGVAAHGGMENSGTIYSVLSKGLAPFHIFNCASDNCGRHRDAALQFLCELRL